MKINVKKLFRIIIPIVWLILFGRLLSRDYFIEKLEIRETQAIQRGLEETYMGIYFQKERIGYVKNHMVNEGPNVFTINQEAVMNLNILDKTYPIKMNLIAELNNASLLKEFQFNLFSTFLHFSWSLGTSSSLLFVMLGHITLNFLFISIQSLAVSFVSGSIAFTGHSGSHTPQSIHSSGFITKKFSPS